MAIQFLNKTRCLIILYFVSICLIGLPGRTYGKRTDETTIDKKIKQLLSEMTLEEKIGQMTQVTIQVVSDFGGAKNGQINLSKLREAILKYHVGSILNINDTAFSVNYWRSVIKEIEDVAEKETRLKIPVIYGIDAIHGANYTKDATIFPQPINMAATFNRELVKKEGEITAFEVRASGIPWIFYPVLGVGRQPLWSRLYETFGEDPYLVSMMGKNYIEGAQGNDMSLPDKVAVCLKHYAGYSFPLNGKDRTPAWIPERMMKEYFLPPFHTGVEEGAMTVMVNSSEVNGIPVHSSYHLLTEVLKDDWKFKGFVVSDWQDIEHLYTRDKVASSPEEAVRMAVMAGVDMSMVPSDFSFYDILLKLVREKKVPMERIDDAVGRILRVKYELGLFDNPYPDEKLLAGFNSPSSQKINLQAAEESITLVKNHDNILPLKKDTKLLVTGPTANSLSCLNGGWTITWQGDDDAAYPKDKPTVLEAIKQKIGKDNVTYVPGSTLNSLLDVNAAAAAAKKADAVILCLGEKAYAETPGNIDDLSLNSAQIKLAKAVMSAGKPVILVMLEGRPRVINKIVEGSSGILIGFLPGMEGGRAIANILFGDANPCGKLPVTYPRFPNALYHYDHTPMEEENGNSYNPQWNFGFGLSYTTFKYSDLTLDKDKINKGESITASIKVTNTGKAAGKEVVQLYLSDLYASIELPAKRLEGFEKIFLNPGETKTVKFTIEPGQLSFIGRNNKRIVEPGKFKVTVSNLSKEFVLE